MQYTKATEIWVGLFVAAGLLALFFLAMQVSSLSDFDRDDGYTVYARFENVGSLKVRSPVKASGVKVGRVSAISYDKNKSQAVVEMKIENAYDHFSNDTTASILTAGLLGEQYIGLDQGGLEDYLQNGSEIDITQSAFVLEKVLTHFFVQQADKGDQE